MLLLKNIVGHVRESFTGKGTLAMVCDTPAGPDGHDSAHGQKAEKQLLHRAAFCKFRACLWSVSLEVIGGRLRSGAGADGSFGHLPN
jgi:hypothetical protein